MDVRDIANLNPRPGPQGAIDELLSALLAQTASMEPHSSPNGRERHLFQVNMEGYAPLWFRVDFDAPEGAVYVTTNPDRAHDECPGEKLSPDEVDALRLICGARADFGLAHTVLGRVVRPEASTPAPVPFGELGFHAVMRQPVPDGYEPPRLVPLVLQNRSWPQPAQSLQHPLLPARDTEQPNTRLGRDQILRAFGLTPPKRTTKLLPRA